MEFGPHLMLASLEGAVIAAILVLTAMGLSIVFGVMRVVNVAHGEFFMLGAVIAWFVSLAIGGHPALGFIAALIFAPLIVGIIAATADAVILKQIKYDPDFFQQKIGFNAPKKKQVEILNKLGFTIKKSGKYLWILPSIGCLYGTNNSSLCHSKILSVLSRNLFKSISIFFNSD